MKLNHENFKLAVEDLPELETQVGLTHSTKQQAVAWPVVIAIIAGMVAGS